MEKTTEDRGAAACQCKAALCRYAQAVKGWADRYLLHVFAIAMALSVFVVGFFTAFRFQPMEQVQAKISIDSSSGSGIDDITSMLFTSIEFEQGMLNPVLALDLDLSESALTEEYQKLTEQVANATGKAILKDKEEFLRLVALLTTASSSSEQAGVLAELLAFMEDCMGESSSMTHVNLIRLDRVEAELVFLQTTGSDVSQQVKVADDTMTRTILLTVASGVYIYLQVIALAMIILSALRFVKGKQQKSGLLLAYFIGFAVLMLLCELTAVRLNGAGIACFVLLAVFAGLSRLYRLATSREMQPAVAVARVASVSLVFAAFCIFFGGMYDFGVAVDRIGALFGLHGYDFTLVPREPLGTMVENFVFIGVPHLICMAMVAVTLLFLLRTGEKGGAFGWILPFISFFLTFVTYVLLNVFAGNKLELVSVSVSMLTVAILCLLAAVSCLAEKFCRQAYARKSAVSEEMPAAE